MSKLLNLKRGHRSPNLQSVGQKYWGPSLAFGTRSGEKSYGNEPLAYGVVSVKIAWHRKLTHLMSEV